MKGNVSKPKVEQLINKADNGGMHVPGATVLSDGAMSLGKNTIAGGKCFNIVGTNLEDNAYVLDDVTGIEPGYRFSVQVVNNYDFCGTVVKVIASRNEVVVSCAPIVSDAANRLFWLPDYPNLGTTDFGIGAISTGEETSATAPGAFSSGKKTKAPGQYSTSIGVETEAGWGSLASGRKAKASGPVSAVIGDTLEASGASSMSVNANNKSTEFATFSKGFRTEANAIFSDSSGYGTKADSPAQHVQGKYNISDDKHKYADIIGNGESDSKRSNAYTLDWQGNGWFAGDVESKTAGKLSEKQTKDNLVTDFSSDNISDEKYPSSKAVYDKLNIMKLQIGVAGEEIDDIKENKVTTIDADIPTEYASDINYPSVKAAREYVDSRYSAWNLTEKENQGAKQSSYIADDIATEKFYYPNLEALNSAFDDFSLNGHKQGPVVQINDASNKTHYVGVQLLSKNLLPYPYYHSTKTTNGITFTVNDDRSITINGTTTAGTSFILNSGMMRGLIVGTTICLSSEISSSEYDSIKIVMNYRSKYITSGNIPGLSIKLGESTVWTVPLDCGSVYSYIYIPEDVTVNNLTVRPYITLGTESAEYTDYVDVTKIKSDYTLYGYSKVGKNLYPLGDVESTAAKPKMGGFTYVTNVHGTYTLSANCYKDANDTTVNPQMTIRAYYTDGTSQSGGATRSRDTRHLRVSLTTNISKTLDSIVVYPLAYPASEQPEGFASIAKATQVQLEYSPVETAYEPYEKETYRVVDTLIPSSPNMTLMSDDSTTALVVDYQRDINKAFDELKSAVLAQGSNT